jgi:hypothetical protein
MAVNVEGRPRASAPGRSNGLTRLTTETKHALKTTEFWAMLVVIAGILIASAVVGGDDNNGAGGGDHFGARSAWLYVAIVAVGYMVSRGLAKSGSREPYWADRDDAVGRDDA